MFAVNYILTSDSVLEAPFACPFQACRGTWWVQGALGVSLELRKRFVPKRFISELQSVWGSGAPVLIATRDPWKKVGARCYVLRCASDETCNVAVYTAPCATWQVYEQERPDFPPPIPCLLYPLRVERHYGLEILHYEQSLRLRRSLPHQPGRLLGGAAGATLRPRLKRTLSDPGSPTLPAFWTGDPILTGGTVPC